MNVTGTIAHRLWRGFLDLAFPPLCMVCGNEVEETGSLCAECWSAAQFIDGPVCETCGLPFEIDPGAASQCGYCLAHPPAFDKARAVMRYDETGKLPILALKHADRLDLVPGFVRWLTRAGKELFAEADLIVPVPLHRWRLWTRRFNQAAELARRISHDANVAFAPDLLVRRRPTPSQGTMASAKARRRNVHGAFAVSAAHKAAAKGKRIVLIDDVMTTGATADACARALKRAGADKVFVLVLARVVRLPADAV
jgi:ComF family protein